MKDNGSQPVICKTLKALCMLLRGLHLLKKKKKNCNLMKLSIKKLSSIKAVMKSLFL